MPEASSIAWLKESVDDSVDFGLCADAAGLGAAAQLPEAASDVDVPVQALQVGLAAEVGDDDRSGGRVRRQLAGRTLDPDPAARRADARLASPRLCALAVVS